jgi:hypothetical protein
LAARSSFASSSFSDGHNSAGRELAKARSRMRILTSAPKWEFRWGLLPGRSGPQRAAPVGPVEGRLCLRLIGSL